MRVLATQVFRAEELRHPVAFLQGGNFVANDVEIGQPCNTVITGPNMGGKSTIIRQARTPLMTFLSTVFNTCFSTVSTGFHDVLCCHLSRGAKHQALSAPNTVLALQKDILDCFDL